MRFDYGTLEVWAAKTKFRHAALEKCTVLADILGEASLDPFLESRLALKGESAVQLLASNPVRLPASLSFNYVGENNWKQLSQDRAETLERLRLIGTEFGLNPEIRDFQDRTLIEYTWQNHLRQAETLPLEVDWTDRFHLFPLQRSVVWTPVGNGAFNALSLNACELGAFLAKEALSTVGARQLHDLTLHAERMGEDWANLDTRRAFALIGSTLPKPLRQYSPSRVLMVTQREVDMNVSASMRLGESVRCGPLATRAQKVLDQLFAFDRDEASFLETLELGHFEPQILFPHRPELESELEKVPAFRFKGVGARKVLPPQAKAAEPVRNE